MALVLNCLLLSLARTAFARILSVTCEIEREVL